MVAMEAIENWDVLKGDMNFDDLFVLYMRKKAIFLIKQKEIYKTEKYKFSC